MLQNHQAAHGGVVSYGASDPRRRARRMRLTAILVTVAVGFSGGLLHQFHSQTNLKAGMGEAQAPIPTGPFAYFPR